MNIEKFMYEVKEILGQAVGMGLDARFSSWPVDAEDCEALQKLLDEAKQGCESVGGDGI